MSLLSLHAFNTAWLGVPFAVGFDPALLRLSAAELEAEAERARLEVCWILWGALPSLDDIDTTRHGYALEDSHADLTRDLLEQAATAVQSGLISTDVGLEVLAWMRAHHPAAIMGRVQL